jgi:cAMP phosphodiesterase
MDKTSASLIINSTVSLSSSLDELLGHIGSVSGIEERDRLRKAVGEVMKVLTLEIIFPIVKEHPELDPDK